MCLWSSSQVAQRGGCGGIAEWLTAGWTDCAVWVSIGTLYETEKLLDTSDGAIDVGGLSSGVISSMVTVSATDGEGALAVTQEDCVMMEEVSEPPQNES